MLPGNDITYPGDSVYNQGSPTSLDLETLCVCVVSVQGCGCSYSVFTVFYDSILTLHHTVTCYGFYFDKLLPLAEVGGFVSNKKDETFILL